MKKISIWLYVAIGLVIIGCGICFIGLCLGPKDGFYFNKQGFHFYEESLKQGNEKLNSFKSIKINSSVMDIKVIKGDKYSINYKYYDSSKGDLAYKIKDDVLEIELSNKNKGFLTFFNLSFFKQENYIIITIPDNSKLDNIDIDNNVGDVTISDLNINKGNIRVDVGQLKAFNVTANDMTIRVNTGDILIENSMVGKSKVRSDIGEVKIRNSTMTDLIAESNVGDIKYHGVLKGNSDFSNNVGDVDITLLRKENEYNYNLKTNIGSVKVNGNESKNENVNNNVDDIINATTDVGDIDVTFSY